jgi:haloalkane dehalogenase
MNKPIWLDKEQYPFESNFIETKFGRLHYIDEGKGDPIVFVHGNPSWSYEFRNAIKQLSQDFRCVAIDHLGFGLSDKPTDWSYVPEDHADNFEYFLGKLNLFDITIVCGDWGGPIGLSYAIKHPTRIKNLLITNTWAWSVKYSLYYQIFSKSVGGFIGRFLIKKRNFFARDIVKKVFGDKKKLTTKVHSHYMMPLNNPLERKGSWIFPKHIIKSSKWLNYLWNHMDVLKDKDVAIAWGMKDIAFRKKELKKWTVKFNKARVIKFHDAGHFVVEEKFLEVSQLVRDFKRLKNT